nr:EOG090X0JCO [Artemia franciscana]
MFQKQDRIRLSYKLTYFTSASKYKSSICLENIYPGSSLNILRSVQKPAGDGTNFTGYVPIEQLKVSYSMASGPGGQNVNKVATKVDVRFHLKNAQWIPEALKEKILEQNPNRITKDGYFVMKSDLTRSQQLNLADALEKIRTVIKAAAFVPAPVTEETLEKIRKRRERAAMERLREKKNRTTVKQGRSAPVLE